MLTDGLGIGLTARPTLRLKHLNQLPSVASHRPLGTCTIDYSDGRSAAGTRKVQKGFPFTALERTPGGELVVPEGIEIREASVKVLLKISGTERDRSGAVRTNIGARVGRVLREFRKPAK